MGTAGGDLAEEDLVERELVEHGHGAADEVAVGGDGDEVDGVAVVGLFEHVEGFSEAEIAQDVHGEPVAPVGHVLGSGPALLVGEGEAGCDGGTAKVADGVAEGADVGQNVALDFLDGRVGEGVRQDAALAGVQVAVAGVVGVGSRVDEGVVELGLAHIGLEAVDFLEGGVGVDGERVGSEADEFAVFLVHAPELEMSVTLEGMVGHVAVGQLGEHGTRVFGKGVEEETVDDEACCLLLLLFVLVTISCKEISWWFGGNLNVRRQRRGRPKPPAKAGGGQLQMPFWKFVLYR